MEDTLIKYDLSLDVYSTHGPAASVLSRPVLPRRGGQPIFMRGELDFKDDGQLRPQVAHNTTHIDMPVHFLEGAADLDDVLNNPAYRLNCIQGEWRGWLRAAVSASPRGAYAR